MSDDITLAMAAVEKWIGNPFSLSLLRFVVSDDKCGNRLSNAIDSYLGCDTDMCRRCRLAGKIVGYTVKKGGSLFGIDDDTIKEGLSNPVFKRGLMNVLKGIAQYGVTKPQIINAPFLVVWDFTHLCNLKCRHCYQDAQKALPDELTTDESKRLIDELASAGVVVIAFSGGEPLMRKDFFEVASYANQKGMYVALASNGTMIDSKTASRLRKTGVDYIEISIDGKDAVQHDAMRGIHGAFDRSVEGIKNCVKEGIYTCIATTVTQDNYCQMNEIYDFVKDTGAKRLICFNFIPTGRGTEMANRDIQPCEREKLLERILSKNSPGVYPEVLSTAPQFARVAVDRHEKSGVPVGHFYLGGAIKGKTRMLADFIGGCGAGRLYCSIEPQGDVQPCVFMPVNVGNVRENDFLTIWHTSPVLKQLRNRDLLKGNCGKCPDKYICGGCRARAWSYFSDLSMPDPGCIKNESLWDEIEDKQKSYSVKAEEPLTDKKTVVVTASAGR
ncbi:radical SAM protein with 4Fe4S-binding SPASM domain [Methanomicrobium sp. W14]|uniref:radical SAM/SPASM domain-containing protein n=1 Tax=Methanomicrobium sp. W14 TaxID=2817839 RepID=UPI001AE4A43D|nr:radical SAM protein [Methanomicrobium sp. W14]MBP2134192.1 radical SAM protein with 4Fe4S-binding SPASM domain [Methanomicrobium sp. W14]